MLPASFPLGTVPIRYAGGELRIGALRLRGTSLLVGLVGHVG